MADNPTFADHAEGSAPAPKFKTKLRNKSAAQLDAEGTVTAALAADAIEVSGSKMRALLTAQNEK